MLCSYDLRKLYMSNIFTPPSLPQALRLVASMLSNRQEV